MSNFKENYRSYLAEKSKQVFSGEVSKHILELRHLRESCLKDVIKEAGGDLVTLQFNLLKDKKRLKESYSVFLKKEIGPELSKLLNNRGNCLAKPYGYSANALIYSEDAAFEISLLNLDRFFEIYNLK